MCRHGGCKSGGGGGGDNRIENAEHCSNGGGEGGWKVVRKISG